MLPIQMAGGTKGDKKLAPIRILATIGHGQGAPPIVQEVEVLVLEGVAVDGGSPRSIGVGEVSPLDHEFGDEAVEFGLEVSGGCGTGEEGGEVEDCEGARLVVQD